MHRVSNKAILSAGVDKAAQESIGRALMIARFYFDFHDASLKTKLGSLGN
jgi:hypothetical protein